MYVRHSKLMILLLSVQLLNAEAICPNKQYGRNCRLRCNCLTKDNCMGNANSTSFCQECNPGFSNPSQCQRENIALQKSVRSETKMDTQSSIVDGNSNTCSSLGKWFEIDLGRNYEIYSFDIVKPEKENSGFSLYVQPVSTPTGIPLSRSGYCATVGTTTESDKDNICDRTVTGRYIFGITALAEGISMCELSFYVCSNYTYGRQCENTCACLDPSEVCSKITGECPSGCYIRENKSMCTTATSTSAPFTSTFITSEDSSLITNRSTVNLADHDLWTDCEIITYGVPVICFAVSVLVGIASFFIGWKCKEKSSKKKSTRDTYLTPVASISTKPAKSTTFGSNNNAENEIPYFARNDSDAATTNAGFYSEVRENSLSSPRKIKSEYEGLEFQTDDFANNKYPTAYEELKNTPRRPMHPKNTVYENTQA